MTTSDELRAMARIGLEYKHDVDAGTKCIRYVLERVVSTA